MTLLLEANDSGDGHIFAFHETISACLLVFKSVSFTTMKSVSAYHKGASPVYVTDIHNGISDETSNENQRLLNGRILH